MRSRNGGAAAAEQQRRRRNGGAARGRPRGCELPNMASAAALVGASFLIWQVRPPSWVRAS